MKRIPFLLLTCFLAVFMVAVPLAAQDAVDLQTYTTEDGRASVRFPAGWVFEEGSDSDSLLTLKVANSPAALEKELFNLDDVFKPGEVHIDVAAIALAQLADDMPDGLITTASTPADILDALTAQGMPDEFEFGDSGEIAINGIPAVRVNLIAAERGEGQLLLTVIDRQWVVAIILYAAPGEGDKWDIAARDLLASVEIHEALEATAEPTPESTVEPFERTQSATTRSGLITLSYPEGWFSRQSGDMALYLSNREAGVDKSFGSAIETGEVNIFVSLGTTADFIEQAQLPLNNNASPLEILQATMQVVEDPVTFGEARSTVVADKRAAHVDFSSAGFEGAAWLIEYRKGTLIAVQLLAAPAETEQWRATTLAIIQSTLLED